MNPTVEQHFERRTPKTREIYNALLASVEKFGPVQEDPKKTSIHLNRKTAFAGIRTRQDHLLLTIKSDREISDARVARSEQTSPSRWHLEVRVRDEREIDEQLNSWLEAAYRLSG